ncbi:H(+)-transporting V0 sector ATPase subunit a [Entomophthora muscae]|uniref:H(+)-transporting V0 sector ATPase subunit a n=1 Tax=Entomophthora muscae TaxID=34485 RepID=A0ACC2TWZ8_9FUNG|nr:H(+)-transporting V0 sector ATPase subunit a [Entomophthora muscae]
MATSSSLFRSETMTFIKIYIPYETAHTTVAQLGEAGLVEFVDLNPKTNAFQRAFVGEIRRLDELDRKLRYLNEQLYAGAVPAIPLSQCGFHLEIRSAQDMAEFERNINDCEARLAELMSSYVQLQCRHKEAIELRHVIIETNPFFLKPPTHEISEDAAAPLLDQGDLESQFEMRPAGLNFVTGVISRKRMAAFERILWRSLRGNLVMNFSEIVDPIVDPVTDTPHSKNAFVIFAFGVHMIDKIRKISESLGATLYPVSEHADLRSQSKTHAEIKIHDLNEALFNTAVTIHSELVQIAQTISIWNTVVKKEKAIYHTLNLFNYDANRRCLLAEGWCAANDIGHVQDALFTSGVFKSSLNY